MTSDRPGSKQHHGKTSHDIDYHAMLVTEKEQFSIKNNADLDKLAVLRALLLLPNHKLLEQISEIDDDVTITSRYKPPRSYLSDIAADASKMAAIAAVSRELAADIIAGRVFIGNAEGAFNEASQIQAGSDGEAKEGVNVPNLSLPRFGERDRAIYPTAESFLRTFYGHRLGVEGDLTQEILNKIDPDLFKKILVEFKGRERELRSILPKPTLRETNDRRLFQALGYVPEGTERNARLTTLNKGQRVGLRKHADRWTPRI